MKRRPDDFCISSRRRLQDSISLNGEFTTINKLFDTDPVLLWNLIHTKGSNIRLISTVYYQLKQKVSTLAPELIEINNIKRELHKSKKLLYKEISTGIIGTEKSSYKKL